MSMAYIRELYGVPVKRGQVVRRIDAPDELLRVASCTHYVRCRPVTVRGPARNHHPLDLEYRIGPGTGSWYRPDGGTGR